MELKIGSEVEIIGCSVPKHFFDIGSIGTIYGEDSGLYTVFVGNRCQFICSDDLRNKSLIQQIDLDADAEGSAGLRAALDSVIAERARQDAKWGQQNHDPQYWTGILVEEVGELCEAINETVFNNGPTERAKGGYANMRREAVEVAAVAVAFVEMLDRRYKP